MRKGTLGPDVIDVGTLYQDTGCFTYDPRFASTASCELKITFIDFDKGIVLYRGYPIEQLAEHSTFLETCYLLLYGELPTAQQYEAFEHRVVKYGYGARANDPVLLRVPPRCASDGGHGRRGRGTLGLLSRLDRYQGSSAA